MEVVFGAYRVFKNDSDYIAEKGEKRRRGGEIGEREKEE